MKSELFRKKSIERVTSPEQLNDYIRVANPGIWPVVFAVFFILLGICVWGVFGRLDTIVTVGAITEQGKTVCYVKEAEIEKISPDQTVKIEDTEYEIESISLQPVQVNDSFSEYLLHVGGLSKGEWVYAVTLKNAYGENGIIFSADIIVESIAPMSFVIN